MSDYETFFTIDPPSGLSKPSYYPENWSENQDIPTVPPGRYYAITVNIPSGYYANVIFYRDFPYSTGSYSLYSNNHVARIENSDPHPYFFFPPHFVVNLRTINSPEYVTKFAFKIQWIKIPNVMSTVIHVKPKKPPRIVYPSENLVIFTGNLGSQISLMAFSLTDPKLSYLLRQSAIFDGDSFDSPFIGTLDQVLTSKMTLTSSGNKISVFTFGLSNQLYCPLYMAQEVSDTKEYTCYLGRNIEENGDCTVTLDGSLGKSLTVTQYDGPEIIKGFSEVADRVTINVYENRVSCDTLVASFKSNNYQEQLPFRVNGIIKFYELIGNGVVQMTVSKSTSIQK